LISNGSISGIVTNPRGELARISVERLDDPHQHVALIDIDLARKLRARRRLVFRHIHLVLELERDLVGDFLPFSSWNRSSSPKSVLTEPLRRLADPQRAENPAAGGAAFCALSRSQMAAHDEEGSNDARGALIHVNAL